MTQAELETDDELTERAAKKVWPEHRIGPPEGWNKPILREGILPECWNATWYKRGPLFEDWTCGRCMGWDPLHNRSDAFQLLELLRPRVRPAPIDAWAVSATPGGDEIVTTDLKRAIVLCAAALP